ncbi:MAG TPA: glycoside hydrolase family 3 C-terminal domain-containing protein [Propionibacteriaceae bacterium]|nr:glycoside hydrolase family 3 C-terminal domain-containing protein [Propionibacteriaceae bacterium]
MSAVGLRQLVFSDGAAGVRGEGWSVGDPSICFPSPAALGSTWDVGLIGRLAEEVAAEATRKGVDVVLAPTVNLQRSPLAGRHFEYLSEDPLLIGRLGAAYVTSLQRHGVAATAKHYVANDAETNRFTVDVRVDDQTLREVYLAPFEQLVTSAGVWAVMAAYNSVNGATMTENSLLTTPLVKEWGFDGVVVSDWYATRSTDSAARGGLTLVMPGPRGPWGPALLAAVSTDRVADGIITDKVRRLLRLAVRVGALAPRRSEDRRRFQASAEAQPDGDALRNLLREAASASVVLASNTGVLPLDPVSMRRLAVLGPNAADMPVQGGGSSAVVPPYSTSLLEALRTAMGPTAHIEHAVGAPIREGLWPVTAAMTTCISCGRPGVHVRYVDAEGREIRNEHRPDGRLVWFGDQLPRRATVEIATRVRVAAAGTWRFGVAGVGHFQLELDGQVVLAEVVRPERPSFASSFLDPPRRSVDRELAEGEQLDLVLRHRPEHDDDFVKAVLGFRPPEAEPDQELATAVALARAADVAVVVVGTDEELETEGRDRVTTSLSGRQDELVRQVAKVNPRTVVVVISGAPVATPWRAQVSALLLAQFGGQEAAAALTEVLLGVTEPGGRLATTWGADDADVPVWTTRPVDGVLPYAEGLDVGYRAWVRTGRHPAYWFGHGLGYTDWAYETIAAPAVLAAGEDVTVRVRIANIGNRRGKEVVQVYLERSESTVRRPAIWLAGFAVVTADPGEVREVDVQVSPRAFQHWSVAEHGWRTEPGAFRLSAGRSAGDRPLAAEIVVTAPDQGD